MYTDVNMQLLTIQETASLLRVSPITVRRYISDGRLDAVRAGKGVRVKQESVERFVQPVEPKNEQPQTMVPQGRPLTFDDPLWGLVGSATDAEPTDSSKKYEYLAEGWSPKQV
jgi:excisionase family DNA binding protein